MAQARFSTFARASAFAKTHARRSGESVRVSKDGDEWVMETGARVTPKPQQLEKPKNKQQVRTTEPRSLINIEPPSIETYKYTPSHPVKILDVAPCTVAPLQLSPGEGVCLECSGRIPAERVRAKLTLCVTCQSAFESTHDTRAKIDEGIAGTRKDNKRMRGQLWGDIRNRSRGK